MVSAAPLDAPASMHDLILLTFAVRQELDPFRQRVGHRPGLTWLLTGIGPRNAHRALDAELTRRAPRVVLTCGFAGGLDPALPNGTVVFDADPDSGLGPAATRLGARPVRFFTADRVVITAAEKRDLRARTGADAVEMESGIVRSMCREKAIPSATVRVISDAAADTLPLDFNRLVDADWRLSPARMALAFLGSPLALPAALRFGRQTRAAAERLAGVLDALTADRTWLPAPRDRMGQPSASEYPCS